MYFQLITCAIVNLVLSNAASVANNSIVSIVNADKRLEKLKFLQENSAFVDICNSKPTSLCYTYYDLLLTLADNGYADTLKKEGFDNVTNTFEDKATVDDFCNHFKDKVPEVSVHKETMESVKQFRTKMQSTSNCVFTCLQHDANTEENKITSICKLIAWGFSLSNKLNLSNTKSVVEHPTSKDSAKLLTLETTTRTIVTNSSNVLTKIQVEKNDHKEEKNTEDNERKTGNQNIESITNKNTEKTKTNLIPVVVASTKKEEESTEDIEPTDNDIFPSDGDQENLEDDDEDSITGPQGNSIDKPVESVASDQDKSNLDNVRKEMDTFPGFEPTDSNFFSYFLFVTVVCIICYVAYHNKTKVLALVVEGRRSNGGRGGFTKRKHTAAYRKLDSNLEEAITSNNSNGRSSTQIIY